MDVPGKKHPIRIVARRTGTPETTLRAWERRYGAVRPERADTGRRLYSDEDIRRLSLIREAVDAGRPVSSVAGLSDGDLARLVEEDRRSRAESRKLAATASSDAEIIDACFAAVAGMDPRVLQSLLNRAILKFPALSLIDEVIAPLLHRLGDYWREGRMSPRHEHMAAAVVRTILSQLQGGSQHAGSRTMVVGTPTGQRHDLGTQFVAALAVSEGWNVVNLGADVPASEIVSAAQEVNADIVALSIVHPVDDPRVEEALGYLGEHLGDRFHLVVGGRGADAYRGAIERAGGVVLRSVQDFAQVLSGQ